MSSDDVKLRDELQSASSAYDICAENYRKLIEAKKWLLVGSVLSAAGTVFLILIGNGYFAIGVIVMMTLISCLSITENVVHSRRERDWLLDNLRKHRVFLEHQAYVMYRNKQMEEGKEHARNSGNSGE